jgi:aerobic carbon-monoxide dehydrogenase large subunit
VTTVNDIARFGSGQQVRRLEDEQLLKGLGQFTDDVSPAGVARLVFLRSPYPHANIKSIDTSAAKTMPGVLFIATGADLLAKGVKPIPGAAGFKRADGSPVTSAPRHALAQGRVRFVGEAVCAVVAETLQQARDAAEAIQVDYEELPVVVNAGDALAAGAPRLCDHVGDNIAAEINHGNAAKTAAAFAGAAHVVKLDIDNQRLNALPIEPRAVLNEYDATTGRLTIRLSSQMPTAVRDGVCDCLGLSKDSVRVVIGDVGGGFGMKTGLYPEDVAVAFCCLQLQRAVKWTAERSEEFLAALAGRDVRTLAELALDTHGRILALRLDGVANVGAYATGAGVAIQLMIGPWVQTGVYDIQTIDFHYRAVLTNTAPTGPYRGAGRPEAVYIIERLMDQAARQSGIDRIELRRRNFIRPEQMPYRNAMGQTYDTGKFEHVMNQALPLADWAGFAAREAASKARGKVRGLGISTFLEWTGGNALEEHVKVAVRADGFIDVITAVNPMGQGILTTLAQLVVDAFGVPIDKVRILMGDTDRINGFGSAGSRSLFTGGSAIQVGAEKTIELGRTLAARELEVAAEDLSFENATYKVKGTDVSIDLFTLAGKQDGQRIHVESTHAVAGPTWPNACHITEVEIDTATGQIDMVAYASVNDVGRVINPLIVRGQLDGGVVQGLGQALCEHARYDRETGQLVTGSLMDYCGPKADIADDRFKTEMDESTPCKNNRLGTKGVGELGTIGATPAVMNAIADALQRMGQGGKIPQLQMPVTSARLWELLQA